MKLLFLARSTSSRLLRTLIAVSSSAVVLGCILGGSCQAQLSASSLSTSSTSGWRGAWTGNASYNVNDLVSYNGGLYVNTAATAPTTNTTNATLSASTNLFDKTAILDGQVVYSGGGGVNYIYGFQSSGLIKVGGASSFVTNLTINIFAPYGIAFYGEKGNWWSGTNLNGNGYYPAGTVVPVPPGAVYVRFWWQESNMGTTLDKAVVNTGTTLQANYTGFGVSAAAPASIATSPSAAPSDATHWSSLGGSTGGPWAGKKMFVLADSIVWANTGVASQIATAVGATLASHGTTVPGVDAVPGRSFDQIQNGYVPISAATIADVDLMLICLGTNQDSALGVGSVTDAPNQNGTMSAQLRWMLETIMSWKPGMRIVVVGPYESNRYNVQAGIDGLQGSQDSGKTVANAGSIAVLGKIDAGMKAVCGYYGIPFLDMYAESGVNFTTSSLWLTDGLHPNSTGYNAFYVPYIAAQLPRFVH